MNISIKNRHIENPRRLAACRHFEKGNNNNMQPEFSQKRGPPYLPKLHTDLAHIQKQTSKDILVPCVQF